LPRHNQSQPPGERTEEERERERQERERRRAARAGEDPVDPPAVERPDRVDEEPVEVPPTPAPAEDPLTPGEPSAPLPPAHSSPTPAEPSRAFPRRAGGRSLRARIGALLALAAAIAAVWLLLQSLHSSGHTRTATRPVVVKVVIPEGETRVQIAQIAAADGLTGSYRAAAKRSALLNPVHYGAPRGTPDLEGFLFPATYDERPGAPVARLVAEQLVAFRENFGADEIVRARALHVTPYQLLTVASMIEREAQVPGDRAKIAAVIYNRLRQGIPLGIDATIYYAVELREGIATYTHELTEAQLHIDSPYNTRTHTGLPPTPISNPGLASIQAAAHPAHVPYLYYVAAADGCGEQTFSTTYAQFERNVAAYQAAVKKNGGHPPTCNKK
jgi:cell division protein YceG involved in septum cleavage